jgi:hypothetical protein
MPAKSFHGSGEYLGMKTNEEASARLRAGSLNRKKDQL